MLEVVGGGGQLEWVRLVSRQLVDELPGPVEVLLQAAFGEKRLRYVITTTGIEARRRTILTVEPSTALNFSLP